MSSCHACGEILKVAESSGAAIGRGDECPKCRGDLRCCKNCEYYDPNAYNECRETVAERVVEKDRSNFCSFFRIAEERLKEKDRTSDAKKKLEQLFRKKG